MTMKPIVVCEILVHYKIDLKGHFRRNKKDQNFISTYIYFISEGVKIGLKWLFALLMFNAVSFHLGILPFFFDGNDNILSHLLTFVYCNFF